MSSEHNALKEMEYAIGIRLKWLWVSDTTTRGNWLCANIVKSSGSNDVCHWLCFEVVAVVVNISPIFMPLTNRWCYRFSDFSATLNTDIRTQPHNAYQSGKGKNTRRFAFSLSLTFLVDRIECYKLLQRTFLLVVLIQPATVINE